MILLIAKQMLRKIGEKYLKMTNYLVKKLLFYSKWCGLTKLFSKKC